MAGPRLSNREAQIMEMFWELGEASIREVQERFPAKKRPGYTTVQTMVNRMEVKGVVRRVRKLGNFHIFAPTVSRDAVQRRLVDELLAMFGGRSQPVMAHMIESGKLTLEDVKAAERTLRDLAKKEKA